MTWTLTASQAAINKAGTHANSTIIASAAALLDYCTDAEGFVCAECHNDFVSGYTALNTQIKGVLSQVVSSLVAQDIVSYDPTGYLTREADTLMNLNDERIAQSLAFLKVKQNQTLN